MIYARKNYLQSTLFRRDILKHFLDILSSLIFYSFNGWQLDKVELNMDLSRVCRCLKLLIRKYKIDNENAFIWIFCSKPWIGPYTTFQLPTIFSFQQLLHSTFSNINIRIYEMSIPQWLLPLLFRLFAQNIMWNWIVTYRNVEYCLISDPRYLWLINYGQLNLMLKSVWRNLNGVELSWKPESTVIMTNNGQWTMDMQTHIDLYYRYICCSQK